MEPSSQRTSGISLLLVENDPIARESMERILRTRFPVLELDTAADGAAGLRLFKEYGHHIILTDISIPVADGIQVGSRIRAMGPRARIIAIMTESETPLLLEAIRIGIIRYLLKPMDPTLLCEAVEDCLAGINREIEARNRHEYIRKLSRAVEQSPNTIVITDAEGTIEYVNPRFTELTGYTPAEALGQNPRILKTDGTPPEIHEELWRTITAGSVWHGEFLNRKKDDELYWEAASISPLFGEDGTITHFIAVKEDITRHKQVEKALQESEKRYRSLFENMLDGFAYCRMLFDDNALPVDFVYLEVNSSFGRLTGLEDVIGRKATDLFPGIKASHPELFEIYGRVASTGQPERFDLEFEQLGRWLSISVYSTERGYFVALFDDITERKQAEDELRWRENRYRKLSITDSLTNLYNSRHFFNQLNHEIERVNRYGQPLSLILMDIDNFKRYNDTYGHYEGDNVLRVLAEVIRKNLREIDIAFRYGGEEFTVLLPETPRENALVVAERIRKSLAETTLSPLPESHVHVTVSIGVGQYSPDEQVPDFVKRVDEGMYRAKKEGKNRVCLADGDMGMQN